MTGWDDPKTAWYYDDFCRRHDRYDQANKALILRAALHPESHVLDLGAGTGGTLKRILPLLGDSGSVTCVEPAGAMRQMGMTLTDDSRVRWRETVPEEDGCCDRILCSAAIWQMQPLDETFRKLGRLLRPDGLICFNIPAQYLGEPDQPGGGEDPWLVTGLINLSRDRTSQAPPAEPLPTAQEIDALLAESGYQSEKWSIKTRLTQGAYRDWLKIPVLTDWLLGDLEPDARAEHIDAAFKNVDPDSWRWEAWYVWSARKVPEVAMTHT